MAVDLNAARECIRRCLQHRQEGKPEAVLRHELTSWLRTIFAGESDATWVNHYAEGTETTTRLPGIADRPLTRFIDTLVRATVIEYEADLRSQPRFENGLGQVREYVAGALRSGIPLSDVRGVLSDTVEWHVFDARLATGVRPEQCRPEDIELIEIEQLHLVVSDEATAARFVEFLRKHLARQQSRALSANAIASDLGLASGAYGRHAQPLQRLVTGSRGTDPSARLATELWSRFVDRIEAGSGAFRVGAYVDEAYLTVLARLLCANVLAKKALLSDPEQLKEILTGRFFEERFHLRNMVEQDYFGWLLREPALGTLLPIAGEIQHDLYAYAYDRPLDEDLLGHMLAEVARRSHRKLLGQEATPRWIAKALADRCVDLIPVDVAPRVLDMCCGSGAILATTIQAIREKRSGLTSEALLSAVCGFDIDPLAVMLAKTTWVVALANEIRGASVMVTIPIYHADSLFAVTPTSRRMPLGGEAADVEVELDEQRLTLPGALLRPDMLPVFEGAVDWAYDEARDAQDRGRADRITLPRAASMIAALLRLHGVRLNPEQLQALQSFAHKLAAAMAVLAIAGRNGIWAYILRNTYRPGLLAGQFNGLVSNPPWLALSQLANNPYKQQLSARTKAYDIRPGGAAHLHTELATTHLLHAIDRYLTSGAAVACLLPGTVLNGQHHEKFRNGLYLRADRPVPFELREVWDVAAGTFRVRAIAVIGVKQRRAADVARATPTGAKADPEGITSALFSVTHLGTRSAWLIGEEASGIPPGAGDIPTQGADLMPRPAVCVVVTDQRGDEWSVRTPRRGDPSHFAVRSAKRLCGMRFAGRVSPQLICRMAQSLNLLPFALDNGFVQIAIPAKRGQDGRWQVLDAETLRTAGLTQTARYFQRIDAELERAGVVKPLRKKIDERNKLTAQSFGGRFLVLNGAGGGVVCAAVLDLRGRSDVVIDQTLYWKTSNTREEAYFRVGVMNSDALTLAIRPLVPEGELGPRHLHTLPSRVMPGFDPTNPKHLEIARLARLLETQASRIIQRDSRVGDPSRPIAYRRRRLRTQLRGMPEFERLEAACRDALGLLGGATA